LKDGGYACVTASHDDRAQRHYALVRGGKDRPSSLVSEGGARLGGGAAIVETPDPLCRTRCPGRRARFGRSSSPGTRASFRRHAARRVRA
jgi:hypothetical protein